jgi:hypothetical protein
MKDVTPRLGCPAFVVLCFGWLALVLGILFVMIVRTLNLIAGERAMESDKPAAARLDSIGRAWTWGIIPAMFLGMALTVLGWILHFQARS